MKQKTTLQFVRNKLIAGLLILLPLAITYFLIAFLFRLLANIGAPVLRALDLGWLAPIGPLVSLLFSLGIIFILGLFGTNIVGRKILELLDRLMLRLPVVRSIYGAVQQMIDTFKGPGRGFQRVVLVEYPRKECWVMGFVASQWPDSLDLTRADSLLAVFVPTTPNPTSGFLILVAPDEVVHVDYGVEEAFKFIVSSGTVGRQFTRVTTDQQ